MVTALLRARSLVSQLFSPHFVRFRVLYSLAFERIYQKSSKNLWTFPSLSLPFFLSANSPLPIPPPLSPLPLIQSLIIRRSWPSCSTASHKHGEGTKCFLNPSHRPLLSFYYFFLLSSQGTLTLLCPFRALSYILTSSRIDLI